MQKLSLFARLACVVTYSDGSSAQFASTVYEHDLEMTIESAGDIGALTSLISDGYFNKAIQQINRQLSFYYSGAPGKEIVDCIISITGNITDHRKRRPVSNIFGVYGDKNSVYSTNEGFNAQPAFVDLIEQWVSNLLENR